MGIGVFLSRISKLLMRKQYRNQMELKELFGKTHYSAVIFSYVTTVKGSEVSG